MILNQIILQSQDLILMKLIVMARNGLFYLEKAKKYKYLHPLSGPDRPVIHDRTFGSSVDELSIALAD